LVNVRIMSPDDFSFAVNVANLEGWDYDTRDLERFIELSPNGLFVCEEGSLRLGWMISTIYGKFMWIGSLVVTSSARRQGVGAALMDRATRYAGENRVRTVALYAHPEAIPFYSALQFSSNCEFLLLQGASKVRDREWKVRQAEVAEVLPTDRKYFLGDRSKVLQMLQSEFGEFLLAPSDNKTQGYIAGRRYRDGSAEIGPWVCKPDARDVAEELLEAELSRLDSRRISIVVPEPNTNALQTLRKHGFVIKQGGPRMYRGEVYDLPRVDGIYAASAWDIG